MKKIITILVLLLGLSMVYSQKDYRPECSLPRTGLPAGTTENFEVKFYTDLYGSRFENNNRCLTPELEEKIKDFLRKPYGLSTRFGRGHNTMEIVKIRGEYYVYIYGPQNPLEKL